MDARADETSDLDIALDWPAEGPEGRPAAQPLAVRERGQNASLGFGPHEAIGIDGSTVQSALSSVSVRLDALHNTATTLRTVIADQLADFGRQVDRSQATTQREIEDYRRLHERSLAALEEGLRETDGAIHRIDRALKVLLDEPPVTDLSGVEAGLSGVEARLSGVEAGLSGVEARLSGVEAALTAINTRLGSLSDAASDQARRDNGVRQVLEQLDQRQEASDDKLNSLANQIQALSEQVEKLRRRVALRAPRQEPVIDANTLEAIAEAVIQRLYDSGSVQTSRRGRLRRSALD